jgi:hypothetical protein
MVVYPPLEAPAVALPEPSGIAAMVIACLGYGLDRTRRRHAVQSPYGAD